MDLVGGTGVDGDRDALRVVGGERARGPRGERRVESVGVSACKETKETDGAPAPAPEDLMYDGLDLLILVGVQGARIVSRL